MNPRQVLRDLLLAIQQGTEAGQVYSDELLGEFSRTINALMDRIEAEERPRPPEIQNGIPAGTDLLWILSGGDVNAFTNYLRSFPGPGLAEIAANPARLQHVIQYLLQNNPIQPPGSGQGGIPDTQLKSSNVSGMQYDPRTNKLLVRFHSDGIEPIYEYDNIPPFLYQILEHGNAFARTKGRNQWGEWWKNKNPSLGAAVNQYLKNGNFAYRRLN